MEETAYFRVAELLKQRTGFDVLSIGLSAVAHAVQQRMLALDMIQLDNYVNYAGASSGELQELVELVMVQETWFFRHEAAFAALTDFALHHRRPAAVVGETTGMLSVLSIPCSTGEEPYSIVMALLDSGITRDYFTVDAIDISTRALALARRAVYRNNAFRSRDLSFRDRYSTMTGDGYQLSELVREQVTFLHDNILSLSTPVSAKRYDVIFCRNVLIYFDQPARQKAILNLERLLKADGLLFVGPAETSILTAHGFNSAGYQEAFAYRKAAAKTSTPMREPVTPLRSTPGRVVRRRPLPAPAAASPQIHSASGMAGSAGDELETAARLADSGQLKEAATMCERHLKQNGASATAYYLLGLIHDAGGDALAGDYYRRALYLEPQHAPALAHLALLLEKQGDIAGARRLRERTRRVEERARTK